MTKFGLQIALIVLFVFIARSSAVETARPTNSVVAAPSVVTIDWLEMDSSRQHTIDRYFSQQHKYRGFNGAILVAEDGLVFKKSYGTQTLRGREKAPITTTTAFQLASVSKPLTAVATLQLVEQGYLTLEDTLSCLLPDFPYPDVTVHQLLSHRSGLPNYMYITDDNWDDHEAPMTMEDAYCILLDEQPNRYYRPGSRYDYSNTNFFLLAYLVETVTPYTYPEWLATHIFKPADMQHSFVLDCAGFQTIPNVAIGTDVYQRKLPEYYLNTVYGDKSIFSSVEDLYKFDQALRQGLLLKPETEALAYAPYNRFNYLYRSYGYGWRVTKDTNGDRVAFHTGWWRGYKTYLIRNLTNDKVIIVLSNSLRGGTFGVLELMRLWASPESV